MKFTVYGPPASQGSKTYGVSHSGKVYGREASKRVMPFRQACAGAAAASGARIVAGPVRLSIVVYAVRPKAHLRANGGLAKDAPERPGGHDASKVARAVEDALAGICYRNDRSVRTLFVDFHYDDGPERVEVEGAPYHARVLPKAIDARLGQMASLSPDWDGWGSVPPSAERLAMASRLAGMVRKLGIEERLYAVTVTPEGIPLFDFRDNFRVRLSIACADDSSWMACVTSHGAVLQPIDGRDLPALMQLVRVLI